MEVYYCKMRRGDIIFSQPSLRKILESINPSRLNDISEFMANHIVKEIKLQEGDVDYDILSEHILKWNKANHLSLNRIEKKNNQTNEEFDVFLSRHSLGKNWSEIECKTYKKTFEIIGNVVSSCEYDEDMFSLTVRKQI